MTAERIGYTSATKSLVEDVIKTTFTFISASPNTGRLSKLRRTVDDYLANKCLAISLKSSLKIIYLHELRKLLLNTD